MTLSDHELYVLRQLDADLESGRRRFVATWRSVAGVTCFMLGSILAVFGLITISAASVALAVAGFALAVGGVRLWIVDLARAQLAVARRRSTDDPA